jgi:N-acetylglucosamine-6-phosphate deacetylase
VRLGVAAVVIGGDVVPGDMAIEDGVVAELGLPPADTDLVAVPGFVDVHFHGHAGIEFAGSTVAEHQDLARRITSTGVTAYQPTLWTMTVESTIDAIGRHPGDVEDGARVLGYHLEGPFLSPGKVGAHEPELLLEPTPEKAQKYLDAGPVEQMTIAPELKGALEIISYLVDRDVTVSLGHSLATSEETNRALDAGANTYTHVFNAMRPFDHREPGILGNALGGDRGYLTAIFDGVHFADEAAEMLIRCAGDRLVAITDGTAATGATSSKVVLGGRECTIVDGAPRHPDGTIAGSILTMDSALRKLVSLGLPLPEAVKAVSSNPARLAKRDHLGSLAVGNPADIAVLDDGLQVVRTIVGGREVFTHG